MLQVAGSALSQLGGKEMYEILRIILYCKIFIHEREMIKRTPWGPDFPNGSWNIRTSE